jgi:hypothetical protein
VVKTVGRARLGGVEGKALGARTVEQDGKSVYMTEPRIHSQIENGNRNPTVSKSDPVQYRVEVLICKPYQYGPNNLPPPKCTVVPS